jgi:hypothetical protein
LICGATACEVDVVTYGGGGEVTRGKLDFGMIIRMHLLAVGIGDLLIHCADAIRVKLKVMRR